MPSTIAKPGRQAMRDMTNEQVVAVESSDQEGPAKQTPGSTLKQITGQKRKSTEATPNDADIDNIDLDGMYMDKSCNQVRAQIRRFLDSGEMKTGEFCNKIDVSNRSLNDFLRQSGPTKGCMSDTYGNAWAYFKRRELAGLKMPTKKAKTTSGGKSNKAAAGDGSQNSNISNVHLDGEAQCSVNVYDTCDEIRKKINTHLKKDGVTQAQFCRDLTAQLHGSGKVAPTQLTSFRSKKGAKAGATSSVFYASFIFFEKMRIASNKPKSKHRVEMESAWPQGFELNVDSNTRYFCLANERPHEDHLGRVTFG